MNRAAVSPSLAWYRPTEGTHYLAFFRSLFSWFVCCVCVSLWLIVLRLERKEGVRRQHVGVEGETSFLTRQCSSVIRFVTSRSALVFGVRVFFLRSPVEFWSVRSDFRSVHGAFSHDCKFLREDSISWSKTAGHANTRSTLVKFRGKRSTGHVVIARSIFSS